MSIENHTTVAYVNGTVVKNAPGTLYGLTGYNSKATAQFIQIHDSASVPSDAAVPKIIISIPATSSFSLDFPIPGRIFDNGITICNSSTGPTKTIGSADIWIDAQFN
jgi:hypothetical protein